MDSSYSVATNVEIDKQHFAEQIKNLRQEKLSRAVRKGSLALSIFSLLVFALTLVSFLFVGMAFISNVSFSLVGIYNWLDALPSTAIINGNQSLTFFVYGAICFVLYVFAIVKLIITAVKLIKKTISLIDNNANLTSDVSLSEDITRLVISSVSYVVLFVFTCMLASTKSLPVITIVALCFFFLLITAQSVLKAFYVYYNEQTGTFDYKYIRLYCVKKLLLVVMPFLTFIFLYQPHYATLAYNVQTKIKFIPDVLIPLISAVVAVIALSLSMKIIRFGSCDLTNPSTAGFKSWSMKYNRFRLNQVIAFYSKWIIVLASALLLGNVIFNVLAVENAERSLILNYALTSGATIISCLSVNLLKKLEITFPFKILF